jgi:ubiquinone/menaquinone biosynthesis C-methylase UbiE
MDSIEAHEESAPEYDRQAREWGWNPEVFLGMMYEYIEPGQKLLDVGIGTGLCSEAFHDAGMTIHGFDGSRKMLQACADKAFAIELKRHDITKMPWPYPDESFSHAICGGVFHFFGDLQSFFSETSRILEPQGTYGFLTFHLTVADLSNLSETEQDFARIWDEASGEKIFKHRDEYIRRLLGDTGFVLRKRLVFLTSVNPETRAEYNGTLYVGQKSQ